jgi:hypothetical protein
MPRIVAVTNAEGLVATMRRTVVVTNVVPSDEHLGPLSGQFVGSLIGTARVILSSFAMEFPL